MPLLFVAALLPRLWTFIEAGVTRVAWKWQIDYAEGVNLNAAYLLSLGHNIYRHNGPDGFISAPYPPFFYALTSPLMVFTGPSFGWGRALSLIATVVVALLLAYVVWRVAGNWAAGVLSGALWLSISPVIVWSAFFKQDIPAMALDLGGLVWALRHPKGRALALSAVVFALAFYTKQSAIYGAAATTLWLLARDWRTGLRFGAGLGGLVLVPFGLGNLLLRGGLYEHLIGYHSLPHTESRFRKSLDPMLREYWPLLIAGGGALAAIAVWLLDALRRAPRTRALLGRLSSPFALLAAYTVFGWGGTLSKLGYEGANFNHLMDGLLPTCMMAGLALAWALERGRTARLPALRWTALGGLGVLLALQVSLYRDPHEWFTSGWPSPILDAENQGIARIVRETPGDAFAEDAYLLLANGKLPVYEDASTFVPLANLKEWDDSAFAQSLRDRRFSLVLLHSGSWGFAGEGLRAFSASYDLKFPGSTDLFVPKLFPDSPQYAFSCTLQGDNGDSVALEGYSLGPGVGYYGIARGDTLRVRLAWRPVAQMKQDNASYVHLLNEKGERVAGQDNAATGAPKPTTQWPPGEPQTDDAAIPLTNDLAPGRYRLVAGMYRAEGGVITPLPATCPPTHQYGDAVLLGEVTVK